MQYENREHEFDPERQEQTFGELRAWLGSEEPAPGVAWYFDLSSGQLLKLCERATDPDATRVRALLAADPGRYLLILSSPSASP